MIPFYIGTYTAGISQGIYRCMLDSERGELSRLTLAAEIDNPTFLSLHPSRPVLYSCREVRRDGKREGSQVVAFEIKNDGTLQPLGSQPSGGTGPCYVSTDRRGQVLLVANYGSGSIAAFPILDDSALGEITSGVQHVGQSVHPDRQEGPHAHCIMSDPSNRYVCAVDLGLDQIVVYQLEAATRLLRAKPECNFQARAGSGPRHLAFHPDCQHAFLIYELSNTLSALHWNAATGHFAETSYVSTLPQGFTGENTTAEVMVHPNGKFVYGSNRGHDSLVAYAFDAKTAQLTLLGHTATGGQTPRNFCIDPTGRYLLAENQDSDSIVVFAIGDNGQLQQVGQPLQVGSPCCIRFATI